MQSFRYSTLQVKEKEQAQVAVRQLEVTRKELEHAKQWKGQFESAQTKILQLELEIKELKEELHVATVERDDSRKQSKTEKEQLDEVSIWSQSHSPCMVSVQFTSFLHGYLATAPPHMSIYRTLSLIQLIFFYLDCVHGVMVFSYPDHFEPLASCTAEAMADAFLN